MRLDAKLDALARLVRSIAIRRGHGEPAPADAIVIMGDRTVINELHATTRVPMESSLPRSWRSVRRPDASGGRPGLPPGSPGGIRAGARQEAGRQAT